jgi:hypothetical protein
MAVAPLMLAVAASGCAVCQSYQDYASPAYGGICGDGMCGGGRVGSVITPGGGGILGEETAHAAPVDESEMPPLEPVPAEADSLGPAWGTQQE